MVFSSVPVYFDPPNWHHQQPNHQNTGSENPHQLPPLPSAAAHVAGVGVGVGGGGGGGPGGASAIRPGSMADRARLAKIPQPEAPLKCPRCDSTNTKFCYFNNYNLSQPRHFCKTCRRYWTRGGALRNVPVGGGCRRNNKKSKSSNSKSIANNNNTGNPQMGSSNSTTTLPSEIIMAHFQQQQQQTPQIPLMASLNNLSQYNMGNIGLNFGAGSGQSSDMGFQIGTTSSSAIVHQFPFFEHAPNTGLYSYQSEGVEASSSSYLVGDNQFLTMASNSRVSAKMEDHQGLNLTRLGISENNNQYWNGSNWTDLSGLSNNTSSTNHFLQNFKL